MPPFRRHLALTLVMLLSVAGCGSPASQPGDLYRWSALDTLRWFPTRISCDTFPPDGHPGRFCEVTAEVEGTSNEPLMIRAEHQLALTGNGAIPAGSLWAYPLEGGGFLEAAAEAVLGDEEVEVEPGVRYEATFYFHLASRERPAAFVLRETGTTPGIVVDRAAAEACRVGTRSWPGPHPGRSEGALPLDRCVMRAALYEVGDLLQNERLVLSQSRLLVESESTAVYSVPTTDGRLCVVLSTQIGWACGEPPVWGTAVTPDHPAQTYLFGTRPRGTESIEIFVDGDRYTPQIQDGFVSVIPGDIAFGSGDVMHLYDRRNRVVEVPLTMSG